MDGTNPYKTTDTVTLILAIRCQAYYSIKLQICISELPILFCDIDCAQWKYSGK